MRSDLAFVTSYFNPTNSEIRLSSFRTFHARLSRIGRPIFVAEFAKEGESSQLQGIPNVKTILGKDMLFQKERLINILLPRLIDKFENICWIDCDIVFLDQNPAERILDKLEHVEVVQAGRRLYYAQPGEVPSKYPNTGLRKFCRVMAYKQAAENQLSYPAEIDFSFPGGVWAARSEFLKDHQLYDKAILGGGDKFFFDACFGLFSHAITPFLLSNDMIIDWFKWAKPVYLRLRGNVTYAELDLAHLYHGKHENRQYISRHSILKEFGFGPDSLRINSGGAYEFKERNPLLLNRIERYFSGRSEAG